MEWGVFFVTGLCILVIVLLQWRMIKQSPQKDKIVFGLLLATGWILSLFDLREIAGPVTVLKAIFLPIAEWVGY